MTSEIVAGYLEENPGARAVLLDFANDMLERDAAELADDLGLNNADEFPAVQEFLRHVVNTVERAVNEVLARGKRRCGVCKYGLWDTGYSCGACCGSMISGI